MKSKTWEEKITDNIDMENNTATGLEGNKKNKAPKSLVNFKEYMET
jgi:hypothetical protein